MTNILNLKQFMNKYNLRDQTMSDSELQKVYNYKIYPRDSKIITKKGFINIDDGSQRGTPWICVYIKDDKSYYFDAFGGNLDKFIQQQLLKPIIYHNFKIQNINSQLCGTKFLYFFYLIERMNYYDAILKIYFS